MNFNQLFLEDWTKNPFGAEQESVASENFQKGSLLLLETEVIRIISSENIWVDIKGIWPISKATLVEIFGVLWSK